MRISPVNPCKRFPSVSIPLIAALPLLLSGWTCRAMFEWNDCQTTLPVAQITSLSPGTISSDTNSVLLTVEGSGFTPQSQIMWNGGSLETTFADSHHLQTTITQQTFESFGGSAGSSVQISVRSQGLIADSICPKSRNSPTAALVVN
jgi:hypothetical protein